MQISYSLMATSTVEIFFFPSNFSPFFVVHISDGEVGESVAGHGSWRCRVVTPEAPAPVLRDGPVMSGLIGSAMTCGRLLSGDIPYLLWLYDGPAALHAHASISKYDWMP